MKRPRDDTQNTDVANVDGGGDEKTDKFKRFGSLIVSSLSLLNTSLPVGNDKGENQIEAQSFSISAETKASSWGLHPSLCSRVTSVKPCRFFCLLLEDLVQCLETSVFLHRLVQGKL